MSQEEYTNCHTLGPPVQSYRDTGE